MASSGHLVIYKIVVWLWGDILSYFVQWIYVHVLLCKSWALTLRALFFKYRHTLNQENTTCMHQSNIQIFLWTNASKCFDLVESFQLWSSFIAQEFRDINLQIPIQAWNLAVAAEIIQIQYLEGAKAGNPCDRHDNEIQYGHRSVFSISINSETRGSTIANKTVIIGFWSQRIQFAVIFKTQNFHIRSLVQTNAISSVKTVCNNNFQCEKYSTFSNTDSVLIAVAPKH